MWSVEYHGGYSKFNDKQRILYGLMCDKEEEKKGLVKAVTSGGCTGIYLLDPDDESALQVAQNTLVTAYNKKDSLSRKDFMIISESGMLWKEEEYKSNIEQLLCHLRVGNLDFLLVRASHLFASAVTTLQRKQAIFSFWTKMIELKALKLVQNIGICDFSIIEMEFIYQLFPNDPPQVLSVEASIASPILLGTSFSFSKVLSFAHSKQMDVIVRFPLSMEAMPFANQAKWNKLTQEIAAIHSEMKFENAVVNEADKAPYVIEKCHRKDVECLHTSLRIVMRWLLQKGVIILPMTSNEEPYSEEQVDELFGFLTHSFTRIAPQYSPTKIYTSLLSQEEMKQIEEILNLHLPLLSS